MHDENTVGSWILLDKYGNLIAQRFWHEEKDYPFLLDSPLGFPYEGRVFSR
jgi:hypothetical protein